ncbi:serine hydrolase [Nocardioides panacis]|uniref:Serine hydrolase n=1 Tax=Nocardioides panacis TaxID=2849501 RepID=A0A975T1D1_9ACTN|nr:serine hydrolase [Nocardioides panacis]QWZ09691.1 serine hydrolase [Nocardioides panacis]
METLEDSAPANVWLGDPLEGVDLGAVEIAAAEQAARPVAGVDDMASYLATQVGDASHRDVLGPLLDGAGPSGVVVRRGTVLASWGDPTRVEMAFSVTKSVLSLVAGIAHDDGLLHLDEPVTRRVDLPQLANPHGRLVTWRHLLDQTSQWEGELWGKPTSVDVQSTREGTESAGGLPGAGWAYNDVRVNLAALALTALLRSSLPDVLRERILDPIGASTSWSWHGYPNSRITLDDADDPDDPDDPDGADEALTPVVSGGAHWGGGLWISALDLARIGHLCLHRGTWGHGQVSPPRGSTSCGHRARSRRTTACPGGSTTTGPSGRPPPQPGDVPAATAAGTCSGSTQPATSSSPHTGETTSSSSSTRSRTR